MNFRSRMVIAIRPSRPYNAGTEHVGLTTTRQTSHAPRAGGEGGALIAYIAVNRRNPNNAQCRGGARRVFTDQTDIACTAVHQGGGLYSGRTSSALGSCLCFLTAEAKRQPFKCLQKSAVKADATTLGAGRATRSRLLP